MGRLVVIEALDDGFVGRASGDAGKISRNLSSLTEAVFFLRNYMTAPAQPHSSQTFPALVAVTETTEVLDALEPKRVWTEADELAPTQAIGRQADPPHRIAPPPTSKLRTPLPQQPTTKLDAGAVPRWQRPAS